MNAVRDMSNFLIGWPLTKHDFGQISKSRQVSAAESRSCLGTVLTPVITLKSDVLWRHDKATGQAVALLQQLRRPFILINSESDRPLDIARDPAVAQLLSNPLLQAWFMQNCFIDHPKVRPLPIGVGPQYSKLLLLEQLSKRLAHRSALQSKRSLLLLQFSLNTNPMRRLVRNTLCDRVSWKDQVTCSLDHALRPGSYYESIAEHMFVVSPPGNGVDAHRTWDALALCAVPIVFRCSTCSRCFLSAFDGLPVLVVNSTHDIPPPSQLRQIWHKWHGNKTFTQCAAGFSRDFAAGLRGLRIATHGRIDADAATEPTLKRCWLNDADANLSAGVNPCPPPSDDVVPCEYRRQYGKKK